MRGAPWARLRWETSHRRRIAHAGDILAQDGSWRFFDRGGDGGAAGRVLPDRTVGDRGRDARQGFFSLRRAAQMNSRWRWRLSIRFARIRHDGRSRVLVVNGLYKTCLQALKGGSATTRRCRETPRLPSCPILRRCAVYWWAQNRPGKPVLFCWTDLEISRERRGSHGTIDERGVETQAKLPLPTPPTNAPALDFPHRDGGKGRLRRAVAVD